jgi:hypothetical protein
MIVDEVWTPTFTHEAHTHTPNQNIHIPNTLTNKGTPSALPQAELIQ